MKRPILITLIGCSAALAQTPGTMPQQEIKYSLAQDLVKSAVVDGKTVETIVQNPATVLPGDILREEITMQNVSKRTIPQVQVSVPIPRNTEFTGKITPDAERWKVQYSIDGGKTFSTQPKQNVTVTENGKTVTKQVTAPISTYTNVRWTVTSFKSDETLKLSFRVKVK